MFLGKVIHIIFSKFWTLYEMHEMCNLWVLIILKMYNGWCMHASVLMQLGVHLLSLQGYVDKYVKIWNF
jgi:hypothetical protein